MKPWTVHTADGHIYLGTTLGRDEEDALKNAREFWPHVKEFQIKPSVGAQEK